MAQLALRGQHHHADGLSEAAASPLLALRARAGRAGGGAPCPPGERALSSVLLSIGLGMIAPPLRASLDSAIDFARRHSLRGKCLSGICLLLPALAGHSSSLCFLFFLSPILSPCRVCVFLALLAPSFFAGVLALPVPLPLSPPVVVLREFMSSCRRVLVAHMKGRRRFVVNRRKMLNSIHSFRVR